MKKQKEEDDEGRLAVDEESESLDYIGDSAFVSISQSSNNETKKHPIAFKQLLRSRFWVRLALHSNGYWTKRRLCL